MQSGFKNIAAGGENIIAAAKKRAISFNKII
jgi:hypothetical protein